MMYTFLTTYRTTDGKRYGGEIQAESWDQALPKAAELGHTIDGVLATKIDCDGGGSEEFPHQGVPGTVEPWDERLTRVAEALHTLRQCKHPAILEWDAQHKRSR